MNEKVTGECLCGKVRFSIENQFKHFHLCHCIQCRKITGSAHASNLFTKPDNIEWLSGEKSIKRFDYPGRQFSKAFCTECGSGVPFTTQNGKALIVPAGSLNQEPNMTPQDNIFWSEKAEWYEAAINAEHFSGFPEKKT